jgi:purine-binding chemotaxis protein CheW
MTRGLGPKRARLDWEGARRRLAAAQVSSEHQHEAAGVLAERARRLAQPLESQAAALTWLEVVTFRRADRRYALESRFLIEVGVCGRLTRVPGAHAALLGMTNLRGDLLPVFDLSALGAAGSQEQPLVSRLVVLGQRSPDFGFLADEVDEVTRLSLGSLSEPHAMGALPHPELMRGIDGDGCVLLDGEAILRDRSVFVAKRSSGSPLEREQT